MRRTKNSITRFQAAVAAKGYQVQEGSVLYKAVRGSIHQLRKPPAWAVDKDILDGAAQFGLERVVIFDRESETTYTAPLGFFFQFGLDIQRGYGHQIGLVLARWQTTTNQASPTAHPARPCTPAPVAEPEWRQLELLSP